LYHGDAALGNDQRRQPDLQMFGRAANNILEVGGTFGLGVRAAAGDRQQHFEIVVLLGQRAVQIQDLTARQQLTAQAFERRFDQAVHECKRALLALGALPETDGHDHERRGIDCGCVAHEPEQIDGLAAHHALHTGAARIACRVLDRCGNHGGKLGGHGHLARPVHMAARIEYAQTAHARQYRAQQLGVRLQ
jgi:hypothetical protein